MFRKIFPLLAISTAVLSCTNHDKPSAAKSEDDLDAARNFIQAALEGKYNEARVYMLQDSSNYKFMDAAERNYQKSDRDTKVGYATASINIHDVQKISDSVTVVIFSNSFKHDHDTLKVVKQNQHWLVDLKYLYLHDQDSLFNKTPKTDTLPQ